MCAKWLFPTLEFEFSSFPNTTFCLDIIQYIHGLYRLEPDPCIILSLIKGITLFVAFLITFLLRLKFSPDYTYLMVALHLNNVMK